MKFPALLIGPLLVSATSLVTDRAEGDSLHKFIKAAGKLYFGNIAEKGKLDKPQYAAEMKRDFGQVTCEYSMKWKFTQPSRDQFTFAASDYVVDWAVKNEQSIRGHTLLWHNSVPDWVDKITDKNELRDVIEKHIKTVVGRWKGKIRAWDVVNKIFDNQKGDFRPSVFYRVLGEEFVSIAFHAARVADPAAKLYINDYNIDRVTFKKHVVLLAHVKK